MKTIRSLYVLILVVLLLPAAAHALPELVYRATGPIDSPESVKRAGGFYARGIDGSRRRQPPPDISLFDHASGTPAGMSRIDSGYVSTTRQRAIAFSFLGRHINNNGYIYHIRPSIDFYDVNASLGSYSPFPPEQEFAALGYIDWNQVIGWEAVDNGVSTGFINNADYRPDLFPALTDYSGINYTLAGFPPDHRAWSREPWRTTGICLPQSRTTRSEETCVTSIELIQAMGLSAFYQNLRLKSVRRLTDW